MGICPQTREEGKPIFPGFSSFQKCTGGILSNGEALKTGVIPFMALTLAGQTQILEGTGPPPLPSCLICSAKRSWWGLFSCMPFTSESLLLCL